MKTKQTISAVLILLLLLGLGTAALAAAPSGQETAEAPETNLPSPAAPMPIVIDGAEVPVSALVMVPARAVGEALGFTVEWLGDGRFTLDDGVMRTTVTWGEDLYTVSSSRADAVGMSAPFSLGLPPYAVDGVSYVPLALFEVLKGRQGKLFRFEEGRIAAETLTPMDGEIPEPVPAEDEAVDVVILSVDEDMTGEELAALLTKYNMTVKYEYTNFHMYALRLEKPLSGKAMAAFLAKLEAEEHILSAEADSRVILYEEPGSAVDPLA